MLFFKSRSVARKFATKKEAYTNVDCGADSAEGFRWAVKVL